MAVPYGLVWLSQVAWVLWGGFRNQDGCGFDSSLVPKHDTEMNRHVSKRIEGDLVIPLGQLNEDIGVEPLTIRCLKSWFIPAGSSG